MQNLGATKEEFQIFLDLIIDPAAVVTDDGEIFLWNHAFEELLECNDFTDRTFMEFTHPDDLEGDVELHRQCVRKERDKYILRKRYITATGKSIWCRLAVRYVCNDKSCYAIATIHDLTKDLETEKVAAFREDLMAAIANRHFTLHYQPIIALKNIDRFEVKENEFFAEEALVRWITNEGLIYPDAFLPTLRMLSCENRLCEIVIDLGIEHVAKTGRRTCINIEPFSFSLDNFQDVLFGAIARHGVTNLGLVILEIVESEAMNDSIEHKLKRLSEKILLSLDDYGSKYNNLARLARLPITLVKLDKELLNNETITRQTISLIHELGLYAIAEGVEDKSQESWLKNLGCDFAQGYLYGKPCPD